MAAPRKCAYESHRKHLDFCSQQSYYVDDAGNPSELQVLGAVRLTNSAGVSSRLGSVYFDEKCSGNPIMDFFAGMEKPGRSVRSSSHLAGVAHRQHLFAHLYKSISYAKVSHDTNPIHVSPVFARYVGLPGTVVHGMHTSALVRRAVEWHVGDADRSRFKHWQVSFDGMVAPNDKFRIDFQHIAMEEGLMIFKVQAFNVERGEKIVEAEAALGATAHGSTICWTRKPGERYGDVAVRQQA